MNQPEHARLNNNDNQENQKRQQQQQLICSSPASKNFAEKPQMNTPKVYNLKHGNLPFDAIRIDRRTKWGNPYIIGTDGNREEVIAKYKTYLLSNWELSSQIRELTGHNLVCHCHPLPCHGDILLHYANSENGIEQMHDDAYELHCKMEASDIAL